MADSTPYDFSALKSSQLTVHTIILTATRTFAQGISAAQRTSPFTTAGEPFRSSGFLCDAIPYSESSGVALIGPVLGASAAVLTCESLFSPALRRVIVCGFAGGLLTGGHAISVGDIVIPSVLAGEDGTSWLYGAVEVEQFISSELHTELVARIEELSRQEPHRIHRGGAWTTDAAFLESPAKKKLYSEMGCICVEMELAAVHQFAKKKSLECGAAFLISDLLGSNWEGGFRKARISSSFRIICEAVLATAMTSR